MVESFASNGSRLSLLKLLNKLGLIEPNEIPSGLASKELFPIAYFGRKGRFEEEDVIHRIAEQLQIEVQELGLKQRHLVLELLNREELQSVTSDRWLRLRMLPVALEAGLLKVAMANPLDYEALSGLAFDLGLKLQACVGREDEILKIVGARLHSEGNSELEELFDYAPDPPSEEHSEANLVEPDHNDAPVIRLVNKIFSQSIEACASDIHLNPETDSLQVRIRVDGIMRPLLTAPRALTAAIISRIKLLSGMDIAERRRPQDGRLRVQSSSGAKDFRLSSVPSAHGENIVIRILSSEMPLLSFDVLGMQAALRDALERTLKGSSRIILVAGPTGSGKTSTLYSSLSYLNDGTRNIITVEDPVEYRIPGITQIQTNTRVGLTFAEGLRSILRQDPDVIMVGEIRDEETASIAVQAAQTGHLVLSTIHTNSAPAAITRLLDLGMPSYLIASSLSAVISQRLVRRLCPTCSVPLPAAPTPRPPGLIVEELKASQGCPQCGCTGYKGRAGIFSLLSVTKSVASAIREGKSDEQIAEAGRHGGYQSLWEAGIRVLNEGWTSVKELERVLGPWEGEAPDMASSAVPATISRELRIAASSVQKRSVLLVEDDDDVRAIMSMFLQSNLYEVREAVNGLDGLEQVYAARPDIILCDLMMPKLGGMEFVRRLRADSRIHDIPVLILTAASSDENQINSLQVGANDFVSKTADSKVLLARIERLLNAR